MSEDSGRQGNQDETSGQPQTQPQHGRGGAGRQQTVGGQDPLQAWTVFLATLFAMAGFAIGVLTILVDAIDESFLEPDMDAPTGGGGGVDFGAEFANLFSVTFTYPVLVFTVALAVFVGAGLAYRAEADESSLFQIAAASAGAGAALFVIVSVILVSTTIDGLSVNFSGLLINAIITGIVAGGASVAGTWTVLNQSPE
ncbi:MAG: hypothetical protein V5A55_06225 [Halovenus sp.]